MDIPDWVLEDAENSDDEVSVEKSLHYRLGPDNLDNTLEYDSTSSDPAAPISKEENGAAHVSD